MKKNDIIKTLVIGLVSVIVFVGAMIGINFYTGPLIEANNNGAMFAPAENVMPENKGFEVVELEKTNENVLNVFKEKSGLGYVFRVKGTSQFSKEPFEVSVAVTLQGTITGINLDKTTESKPLTDGVLNSFIGNDGTLANVELTGGTTFTATAIKNAVEEGFKVLVENNLVQEAVKTPEQLLTELMPLVHTGLASEGVLKTTAITDASGNIASGFKANNNTGYALFMNKGEEKILVVTNAQGAAKAYNTEGADVTAENADLITEALAYTTANQKNFYEKAVAKFTKMITGATNFNEIKVEVFNNVVVATEFEVEGAKYYGFNSKTFGYDVMDIYVVVDATGKIVKATATEFFIDPTGYIPAPEHLEEIVDKFVGLTTPEEIDAVEVVSKATLSSKALKNATKEALATFKTLNLGGNK